MEFILEKVNELKSLFQYEEAFAKSGIIHHEIVEESEVFLFDYDSPSSDVTLFSCWGEKYSHGEEALYPLLNNYLDIIANREIRESRSLSYSVSASLNRPKRDDDFLTFSAFALTQNDKIRECIETFNDFIRNIPRLDTEFDNVKESIYVSNRNMRLGSESLLGRFKADRVLGYDYDRRIDVLRDIKKMTFEDMVEFHKRHLGDHPFKYMIVGRIADMDMDYFKTLGPVTILTEKEFLQE